MSVSSAKAKLDAQGGDPVTGYISKTDVQESYDELVNATALTGTTTAAAITCSGAVQAAAASGFVLGASGPKFISGSGSPLGAVSAPVGSIYVDTAVTTGAAQWVKISGTDNTGWRVTFGDTYWIGVSTWDAAGMVTGLALAAGSAAPMSGQAGGIYLRRTGDTVWCRIHNLTTSGSTTPTIFEAGWNTSGFKMQGTYSVRPIAKFDGSPAAIGTTYSSAYLQGYGVADPYNWQYMETCWQTPDAWPTSLPGPVVSI